VQQFQPGQARPVNAEIGPVATTRNGQYMVDVSPSFAVPGAASLQLQVSAEGVTAEIPGGTLSLQLGVPPRDTARFDADLGLERDEC
jgi:hypothetical protein